MNKRGVMLLPARQQMECAYCGMAATCVEHFEPWSLSQSKFTLPACDKCNSTLSAFTQRTLGERCAFIVRKTQRRNRGTLRADFRRVKIGTKGALRNRLSRGQAEKAELNQRFECLEAMQRRCGGIILSRLRPGTSELDELIAYLDARWDGKFATVPPRGGVPGVEGDTFLANVPAEVQAV